MKARVIAATRCGRGMLGGDQTADITPNRTDQQCPNHRGVPALL